MSDEISIIFGIGIYASRPAAGNAGAHYFATDTGVQYRDNGASWVAETAVTLALNLILSGEISPTQLAANTDNWNPTGLATASVIRASTDASRNLTGIVAQTAGTLILLHNVGAFSLVLKHDATSTAANRFYCPGSADKTITTNSSAWLRYDGTSLRWRVVA